MNYIILDLEATCWEKRNGRQNEIIEIGAVKLDKYGHLKSEFNEFIKPKLNSILSEFCKSLTTIKQSDVDEAESFETVIKKFKNWIDEEEDYILCSWGFYDKSQFIKDCNLYNLSIDWLTNHISLKHQYAQIKNLRKPIGMNSALKKEGLELHGTHHRGIDDARNIVEIFLLHFEYWET